MTKFRDAFDRAESQHKSQGDAAAAKKLEAQKAKELREVLWQTWLNEHILPILRQAQDELSPDVVVDINHVDVQKPGLAFAMRKASTRTRHSNSFPIFVTVSDEGIVRISLDRMRGVEDLGQIDNPQTAGAFESRIVALVEGLARR